jgi:hypothetical protein
MDARPARREGLRSARRKIRVDRRCRAISTLPPTAQSAMVTIYACISWWLPSRAGGEDHWAIRRPVRLGCHLGK